MVDRPFCPKCKKPMRLIATGIAVKVFNCGDCKEIKIVNRENPEELIPVVTSAATIGSEE